MEIPQTSARSEFRNTDGGDRAGESGGSAGSDCARAMAQAERVLREISLTAFSARRRSPGLSSFVSEKAESAIPGIATIRGTQPYTHSYRAATQFGIFDLRLAKAIPERVPLDLGLDFVVHDDGAIELTETGFRRMAQAHSAGLDAVIGVERRDVLRFPAPGRVVADALPRGGKVEEVADLRCPSREILFD